MSIRHRLVEYRDDDTLLEGYLAYDDQHREPRPGIIIAPTWRGRSPMECRRAEQLAELGYAGFALDMYGKGILGNSAEEHSPMMQAPMDDGAALQRRMTKALAAAREHAQVDADKMAVMGVAYNAAADRRSWQALENFLAEVFT